MLFPTLWLLKARLPVTRDRGREQSRVAGINRNLLSHTCGRHKSKFRVLVGMDSSGRSQRDFVPCLSLASRRKSVGLRHTPATEVPYLWNIPALCPCQFLQNHQPLEVDPPLNAG